MSSPSYLSLRVLPMVRNFPSGLLASSGTCLLSFYAWNCVSPDCFFALGTSGCSAATARLISLNSSAATSDSASYEPAEAHAMERLKSPATVMMLLGPGSFIFR